MKTISKIGVGAVALTMLAVTPAAAQNYRDRDRDNTGRDAVLGAVVGGVAGALIGQGDGRYIAGGALAGAALGAVASDNDRDNCDYYRGGRCYRNQGHWEREHGINSRDGYYNGRYQGRDNDRGYYRDGRYWRNHGEWRSHQNRRDRDYRYDRRW
ncbi:hypothetical protein ABE444_11770 [Brevundimonas pondensis]|jgi:hypothetical protein|uniref:17 kDa surface antigen n=1 Tax=Brevundimonas pondensis TaxID=2774189 RepID=A0ABX7SJ57_9CAUL|nr:hypothetical protein [Brevundimonas pondensis]QTC87746.1 hypothetical protein IFE19_17015 [Brevundimonas pondensis]